MEDEASDDVAGGLEVVVEVVVVVAVLRRCTMISQDDLEAARREQESADECLDLAKKKTDDAARIHEQMESFLIQADLARKAATEFQQKVDDCLRQVGSARTLFEETMLEADRLRSEAAALIRSALARLDGKKKQSCST